MKLTKQGKIGAVLTASSFLVAIIHFLRLLIKGADILASPKFLDIIVLVAIGIVGLFTVIFESKLSKWIIFSIFHLYSYFALFNNGVGEFTYMIFFIYSLFIAERFELLKKHFYSKIVILHVLFLSAILIWAFVSGDIMVGISPCLIIFAASGITYLVFEEEIKKYMNTSSSLKAELQKNSAYIEYGKNIGSFSHTMNNQIGMIINYLDMMDVTMRNKDKEKVKNILSKINKGCMGVLGLVNNLANLVKNYNITEFEIIDVATVVNGCIEMVKLNCDRKMKEKNILKKPIVKVYSCDEKITIETSPMNFSVILQNILDNAVDSGATLINVTFVKRKETVTISVNDNGCGIKFCSECKNKNCINCDNFKVGKTTKDYGHGIGMYDVKRLLNKINGELTIDSKVDEGTNFILRLPTKQ